MDSMEKLMKILSGFKDPRGLTGILNRGSNIYNGGSSRAHAGGGPQFGHPVGVPNKAAILRKLNGKS